MITKSGCPRFLRKHTRISHSKLPAMANREITESTAKAAVEFKEKIADLEAMRLELEANVKSMTAETSAFKKESSNLRATVAEHTKKCADMELQVKVKEALILEHVTTIDRQNTARVELQAALDEKAIEIHRLSAQYYCKHSCASQLFDGCIKNRF
jgi:chromosome segregation ATPase